MAVENLGASWTIGSNENTAFSVTDTKLTITDCRRIDNCYITKDADIAVSGDFSYTIDVFENASSAHDAQTSFFLGKNRLGDQQYQYINSHDSLGFWIYEWTSTIVRIQIIETTGGSIYSNGLGVQLTPGSGPWYCTLSRTSGTATVEVFSDSARTSSLGSNDLTLQSTETYTVAAIGGWDDNNSAAKDWDGWYDNVDLGLEAAVTGGQPGTVISPPGKIITTNKRIMRIC